MAVKMEGPHPNPPLTQNFNPPEIMLPFLLPSGTLSGNKQLKINNFNKMPGCYGK